MDSQLAIKVSNVSKNFILPHERANSIKSMFINPFREKADNEVQNVLKNVTFEINKGEFFGIVGRNGSGKSTLLKILAGIYQPNKGSVNISGRLVPFIELGVGFSPELTGRENVFLNGALLGFSQKEIEKKYRNIVEFAGIKRFMDQKLKNYSSGMQVRLAFSVATILAESDILLIDEVLAVGDADFQRKCFDYFKQLKKDQKTVVFVSHDMSAIREYCSQVILIDNGEIVAGGDPNEIADRYNRLFTEDVIGQEAGKESDRWGDSSIITDNLYIDITPEIITITQAIKAKIDAENPIVGFRIRDAAGKEVLGTNTKIEGKKVGSLVAHKKIDVTWVLPNILSDGKYTIDCSIHNEDSVTVADWWNNAAHFVVRKQRHVPYPIDPGYKVTVK
jgi:ABC-2 type transport system ATP-binding protein